MKNIHFMLLIAKAKEKGISVKCIALLTLGLILLATSPVFALPIIFTASGTAGDGRPDNAKATIEFLSLTKMTITLENTAGPGQLGGISSVLDGFKFTFSTAPATINLENAVTIGGIPQILNCTTGSCVSGSGIISPYGWTVTGTLASPLLAAGNASYKPYGIVNNNIQTTDGIPNAQHNPYLNGPVTFTLDLTGFTAIPDITSASFYFGTEPDIQTGVKQTLVPEPGTMLLLGLGFLGLGITARKRS
jgi:hypothetical protein